ncbi:MAG: CbrC family protein [Planctomycetes bacterium]|nr:CbrC family protein [Planctomycetota bacterium]
MSIILPSFKYYPDPLTNKSIVKSRRACVCCKKSRGYIYAGPVYSEGSTTNAFAHGALRMGRHKKLDVTFFTEDGVGGNGDWVRVPRSVVQEITCRTPGFSGWQQEQWWTHCRDAGRYLGKAGLSELKSYGADAIEGHPQLYQVRRER